MTVPYQSVDMLMTEIRELLDRGLDSDAIAQTIVARELRAKGWSVSRISGTLRQPVDRIVKLLGVAL